MQFEYVRILYGVLRGFPKFIDAHLIWSRLLPYTKEKVTKTPRKGKLAVGIGACVSGFETALP